MNDDDHYRWKLFNKCIQLFDVVIVILLFTSIEYYFQYDRAPLISNVIETSYSLSQWFFIIILGIVWNLIFAGMRLYHFRFWEPLMMRIVRMITGAILGTLAFCVGASIFHLGHVNFTFLLLFNSIAICTFVVYRIGIVFMLKVIRQRKINVRNVIMIGINKRSVFLANVLKRPFMGVNLIGYMETREILTSQNYCSYDIKCLCSIEEFSECVAKYPVDEVLIALPIKSFYNQISEIIAICTIHGIKARYVSDFFDVNHDVHHKITRSGSTFFMDYDITNQSELLKDIKRILDILIAATALIVLLPVFAIIAICVYWSDGRPIMFVQERVGLNKRLFKMYKFRTMVKDAERMQADLEDLNEVKGAAFKIASDPRVTKIGEFLRKTSLDELPQFWHVLTGSMSIVGPRPLPIRDYNHFYKDTHRRRFSVKPGLTGLWQISGRSEVDFEKWMALDLKYIDNWSIWLDLKIILATLPAILMQKGAK
jgi:exopolysaccharide biosynthesis polyprenyl glycosylphosphotransferase